MYFENSSRRLIEVYVENVIFMTDNYLKISSVEKLKILKSIYTYKELEKHLEIPTPVLARYISLQNLPNIEKAKKITSFFDKIDITKVIEKKMKIDDQKIIDATELISDLSLLKILALRVNIEADVVLTMAVDGITWGTLIADHIGARIVYAKEKEEPGVRDFYTITTKYGEGVLFKKYYLPKNLLNSRDKVLIVDDIIRTGNTLKTLIRFAEQANAKIVGGAALLAKKEAIEELSTLLSPFIVIYKF